MMNLTIGVTKPTNIQFGQRKKAQVYRAKFFNSKIDSFERTQRVKALKGEFEFLHYKAIYDDVYEKVLQKCIDENPIFQRVKINKPKLKINNRKDSETFSSYNFNTNTIKLSKKALNDDYYACGLKDKNGKIIYSDIGSSSKILEAIKACKKKGVNLSIKRLNKDEKELFIKCAIAHEIRHCFIDHLLVSQNETAPVIKEKYQECKNDFDLIYEKIEQIRKPQKPLKKIDFSYIFDYVPKELIDDDVLIGFNYDNKTQGLLSLKEHFLTSTLEYLDGYNFNNNEDYYKYLSSANELDAYNFEYNYLLDEINNICTNKCRDEILKALVSVCKDNVELSLEAMIKRGINFI